MGLFSSTKSENLTPLPFLDLGFEHSIDAVINPGNTIGGTIQLSTPVPITPTAVEVTFWGQSQTWIRKSSSSGTNNSSTDYYHYRDLATLFTVIRNVLPQTKESHIPGQTYAMPFSFTMPTGTAQNRAHCYKNPEIGIWTVAPHDLPPTFMYAPWGQDAPNNCSISYGVTTRLICPGYSIDQVTCTRPILFAPLNPYAHIQTPNRIRQSKSFTLSSSTLAGETSENIGFRRSLKDKFSSHAPKLDFELAVELPDLLRSGAEFRFRTTFATLRKTDNVILIPDITFRVLKLELLDFTLFRGPRDWKANNFMSGAPSKYRDGTPRSSFRANDEQHCGEEKTLLNSLPEFGTVALPEVPGEKEKGVEQGKECEFWFRGRIPATTPPSFQSFSITRRYRIRVKVEIEIGGKRFDFTIEGTDTQLGI